MTAAFILSLCLFTTSRPAVAGVHQVWDEAHFVKLATIEQVDQVLDAIHDRFGKDLMIETFASIPDDLKATLQKDGKEKFYEGWSITEGRELGVNGVLILVTGDPPHIQVTVGLDTRKKAFTLADRDELLAQLATSFRAKDFDGGMTHAAQFVQDRMARNLGGAAPATQPASQPAALPTTRPAQETGPEAPKPAHLP
jgi:uncharacterized membrane protein YgcG